MKPKFCFLAVFLLLLSFNVRAADFYLKDGDRVVFYGDSITDQRLYTTFTETYVVTRFPKMDVTFVHSGWGGDRVSGGGGGPIDVRLERDVFAYKPTVMTIMLGMNDGKYRPFDEKIFDDYKQGYEHIIASVKEHLPGIRITVIQPSPFDDVTQAPNFEGGYNSVLKRYSQFVEDLAAREHIEAADLNAPIVAALEKAKALNADLAKKIIPDRVHPGPAGHLLMAGELLQAWNAPAIVTSVEINGASGEVVRQDSTTVSEVKNEDGAISWKQRDESLPMPVNTNDALMALAVSSSEFLQRLDQQPLRIAGLEAPRYTLKIDGIEVGRFSKEALSKGINLAVLPTPMFAQATRVHELTLQHNNIHFTRWRQVQVPLANQKSPKVQRAVQELLRALDEEEAAVVKEQRAAAEPVEHAYRLQAE